MDQFAEKERLDFWLSNAHDSRFLAQLTPQRWYISSLDKISNDDIDLEFFFPPEDFNYNPGGGEINEFTSFGMSYPIMQWIRGASDEITFNSMIWHHDPDSLSRSIEIRHAFLKSKLDRLVSLTKYNKELRRPPVCGFKWSIWEVRCLVASVNNIEPIMMDGHSNYMLGYKFAVTIKRYEDFDVNLVERTGIDIVTRANNTKFIQAGVDDTYEMIAYREFGDPLLGVSLRRMHPRNPDLQPGDTVMIPSRAWAIQQQEAKNFHVSPLLSMDEETSSVIDALFEALSR